MTFLEIQNAALTACGLSTSATSDARTRVKSYVNQWHRRILARPGFSRLLRDSVLTFDSVADQLVYGLGIPMARINAIHERTNDWQLVRQDLAWLRCADPGLTSAGSPQVYIPRGWFPVKVNPSNASSVHAISTNAADTTQIVDWEFVLSSGDRASGNTTLNGTTVVQLGTATTVVEVTRLSLRTAGAGTITVREDSGTGAILLTLPIGATFGRFLHLQLWPSPNAVITYRVDYTREIVDLVQDTEIPLLPPDFHHILVKGAEHDEWRRMDDDRFDSVRQDLEVELRYMNHWVWESADSESASQPVRHSRLGAWFPAGT
jgi:hypothetical protein